MIKVRDAFSHDSSLGDTIVDSSEGWESLTDESQAKQCDVNWIVSQYLKTGVLPSDERDALYGDFTDVPDYRAALDIVRRASEQFQALDAKVRNRFDNDPAKFLEFAQDPRNGKEMVEMGLAVRREAPVDSGASSKGSAPSQPAPAPAGQAGLAAAQNGGSAS